MCLMVPKPTLEECFYHFSGVHITGYNNHNPQPAKTTTADTRLRGTSSLPSFFKPFLLKRTVINASLSDPVTLISFVNAASYYFPAQLSRLTKKGAYLSQNRHERIMSVQLASHLAATVYFGKLTNSQFGFRLLKTVELRYPLMNC